jgi:hypothetical protein
MTLNQAMTNRGNPTATQAEMQQPPMTKQLASNYAIARQRLLQRCLVRRCAPRALRTASSGASRVYIRVWRVPPERCAPRRVRVTPNQAVAHPESPSATAVEMQQPSTIKQLAAINAGAGLGSAAAPFCSRLRDAGGTQRTERGRRSNARVEHGVTIGEKCERALQHPNYRLALALRRAIAPIQ